MANAPLPRMPILLLAEGLVDPLRFEPRLRFLPATTQPATSISCYRWVRIIVQYSTIQYSTV